jgi:DNA-binding CsgD family transcriptional regulator
MAAPAVLHEYLLDVALQRTISGFQESAKRTLTLFGLSGWAIIFPSSSGVDGRPVFMGYGLKPGRGPLLTQAAKQGIETIYPPEGPSPRTLAALAQEISPQPGHRCQIIRSRRDKGSELTLFCFRPGTVPDFSADELDVLNGVGRMLDRCFAVLAEDQENQFEAGLLRLIGNLHPEGLCVLDNRLRVVFENRKFKEQMHLWNHGLAGAKSLTLPKQSELPPVWQEACERSFKAFREVKLPAVSGRMVVSQGPLSEVKHRVDETQWLDGAVRYIAFQSAFGVRPYLLLTSSLQRQQTTGNGMTTARIAEQLGFSRRETELAGLILKGSSAREIADALKIALPTVKTHIRNILYKAGVKTRLQFVGLFRSQG